MRELFPDDSEIGRLWKIGRFDAACTLSGRLIAAIPRIDHPFRDAGLAADTARQWHAHGVLCWHNGRFDDANTALGQAYALRCALQGDQHPDSLETLERLAALAHSQLDDELALKRFDAALDGFVRLHGEESVRVAIVRRNYAAFLRDRSRAAEARALIDRATDVLERELPPAHPDNVAALKVEALLFVVEGEYPAAARVAERAIELGRKELAEEHPFIAAAELILATTEIRSKEFKKAEKRLARVLKHFERSLRERHPLVAITISRQAQLLHARGASLERAEELARRAFEYYGETYPKNVGGIAWTLFEILLDGGKPVDAADLATELAPAVEQRLRLAMAGKLANRFLDAGDYRTALPWIERARDASDDDGREQWTASLEKWTRYVKRFEVDPRDLPEG
jgi:hypothetical protein